MISNALMKKSSRRELSKNRLSSFKNLYGAELEEFAPMQVTGSKLWFDKLAINAGYKITGRRLCVLCVFLSVLGFGFGLLSCCMLFPQRSCPSLALHPLESLAQGPRGWITRFTLFFCSRGDFLLQSDFVWFTGRFLCHAASTSNS